MIDFAEFKEVPESQYCLTDHEKYSLIAEGAIAMIRRVNAGKNPYNDGNHKHMARLWLEGYLAASKLEDRREQNIKEQAKQYAQVK